MNEKPKEVIAFFLPNDYEKCAEKWFLPSNKKILGTYCYHWTIDNWSDLENPTRSPVFKSSDGTEWNILVFPEGTNGQRDYVSLYIEAPTIKKNENGNIYCCAQFALALTDTINPARIHHSISQHRFTSDEAKEGFKLSQRIISSYLVGNKINITAILRIVEDSNHDLWHKFGNCHSEKQANYVGLCNQGATCYMNSLLQSLYFTNYYRKAVYQIPTENKDPFTCTALALQRVFYNLQFSNDDVTTSELTKALGWDPEESSTIQKDVQEFNRQFQDILEKEMEGTDASGVIPELFMGIMKSYTECINVPYKTSKLENYYDIQLNVKNCATLEDSFNEYCAVEILKGRNQYQAEGHGLQDARRGFIFESFPPVLHLQLKRFEYDMENNTMVKINDRHEFPPEIDLRPYMSSTAENPTSANYILHSVLVHYGSTRSGHYVAFVRPTAKGEWFNFNDTRVTLTNWDEVSKDSFGGEILNSPDSNASKNAYMLVYIRESCQNEILAPVTKQDIPSHLIERIRGVKENWNRIIHENQEQYLYPTIFLIWDNDFCENKGCDFIQKKSNKMKLGNINLIRSLSFPRDKTYGNFIETFEKETGLSSTDFRLWVLINRENGTMRPDIPIPSTDYTLTLEELLIKHEIGMPYLRLYVEYPKTVPKTELAYIMVFVKFFDPHVQTISGIGKLYLEKRKKLGDIKNELTALVGLEKGTPIDIFEEIQSDNIIQLNKETTIHDAELQNGDILCIQEQLSVEQISALKARDMLSNLSGFLTYLSNHVSVYFIPSSCIDEDKEGVKLILAYNMSYFEIMQRLADNVNETANNIQLLVASNCDKPKSQFPFLSDVTLKYVLQACGRNLGRGVWQLRYRILSH